MNATDFQNDTARMTFALAHLGAGDPHRELAFELLLTYLESSTVTRRFLSWSEEVRQEARAELLYRWCLRARPITWKRSPCGLIESSFHNTLKSLGRASKRRAEVTLDETTPRADGASPDDHPPLIDMPTLGELLQQEDVDALLLSFVSEHIIALQSRRTRETDRRMLADRLALALGESSYATLCARELGDGDHDPEDMATQRNTIQQRMCRMIKRLEATLERPDLGDLLGLTRDEVRAITSWIELMITRRNIDGADS